MTVIICGGTGGGKRSGKAAAFTSPFLFKTNCHSDQREESALGQRVTQPWRRHGSKEANLSA